MIPRCVSSSHQFSFELPAHVLLPWCRVSLSAPAFGFFPLSPRGRSVNFKNEIRRMTDSSTLLFLHPPTWLELFIPSMLWYVYCPSAYALRHCEQRTHGGLGRSRTPSSEDGFVWRAQVIRRNVKDLAFWFVRHSTLVSVVELT